MDNELFVGRSEYKYFLSFPDAARLAQELDQVLLRDAHSQNGSYRVKSLYFDSWQNKDFVEKLGGYEERKKIRLRIYDESAKYAKLELKQKSGNYQHKHSVLLTREEARQLMEGEYGFLMDRNEKTAQRIYCMMRLGAYRPVVIVDYDRTAYVSPNFSTRITFDTNVKGTELELDLFRANASYQYALKDNVLVEIKFNQYLPEYLTGIFRRYPLTNISFSKYCGGRKIFENYLA